MCVVLCVSARPSLTEAKGWWVKLAQHPVDLGPMPSRQERRRAERDAAKRAPGPAGAGGAGGAAAALENVHVNVNPVGDWTTQEADPEVLFRALGAENVKRKAAEGDGQAQFSQGSVLVCLAEGNGVLMGTGGRSPMADVGSTLSTEVFAVAHWTEARRCGHLTT